MKVSDYIADFIAKLGIRHTFGVVGGGAMHLNESFGHHKDLTYVACHHEQAAAMAADAYARINGIGCALVTTGPGGTNAITGVAAAFIDSVPVIFISGQVETRTLMQLNRDGRDMYGNPALRQLGVQESDIVSMVRPITKFAKTVTNEHEIQLTLEMAAFVARDGRPGPVWIDIPVDLQSKQIEVTRLRVPLFKPELEHAIHLLRAAQRPVLIIGNGAREADLWPLIDALGVPVITSWGAADMLADHPLHIGHMGLFGDRASNFTVQNADLLLVIGCRLSIPQIGHNFAEFAPKAKIIMVDIDVHEFGKPSLRVDLKVQADAGAFVEAMLDELKTAPYAQPDDFAKRHVLRWPHYCSAQKERYPVVLPEYASDPNGVNAFHFIDVLCDKLPADAIVVTDVGSAYTCTYQAAKMKFGQRWISAHGLSPMGYGLPGAVGAAFATGKKVVCIVGDGALQFNVQELATIRQHNLPVTIFVLSNGGYLTIKHTQDNHFKRRVGSDGDGLWLPSAAAVGGAYRIPAWTIRHTDDIGASIDAVFGEDGPLLIDVVMPHDQPLIPRVQSIKHADGSISAPAIHDMYPHLSSEEMQENML